jgi:hypothetical protein
MKNLTIEDLKELDFTQADALIQITEKIIHRHQEIGPSSPLNPGQIADLNYKINHARVKHNEGLKYQRLMENAWAERDRFLGIANTGEAAPLPSTIENMCRFLMDMFKADRKELEKWF